jgi:hypothetical protein
VPHEPRNTLSSAARTTAGTQTLSAVRDAGTQLHVMLDVTAVTGTSPTLDVEVQWSHDGTRWASVEPAADAFSQIVSARTVVRSFPVRAPLARLSWTVGGTSPSFTFGIRTYTT